MSRIAGGYKDQLQVRFEIKRQFGFNVGKAVLVADLGEPNITVLRTNEVIGYVQPHDSRKTSSFFRELSPTRCSSAKYTLCQRSDQLSRSPWKSQTLEHRPSMRLLCLSPFKRLWRFRGQARYVRGVLSKITITVMREVGRASVTQLCLRTDIPKLADLGERFAAPFAKTQQLQYCQSIFPPYSMLALGTKS